MSGNTRKNQVTRLVTLRHQSTMSGVLSLLGWSAAGAFAAAAGLFTARTAYNEDASRGRVLFEDVFAGPSLSQNHWNPYICDNNSNGWPWLMQPNVAVASSAIGGKNGRNAAYALPSAIRVDHGLTLRAYRGTKAAGYSWTGSVICSRPTSIIESEPRFATANSR